MTPCQKLIPQGYGKPPKPCGKPATCLWRRTIYDDWEYRCELHSVGGHSAPIGRAHVEEGSGRGEGVK